MIHDRMIHDKDQPADSLPRADETPRSSAETRPPAARTRPGAGRRPAPRSLESIELFDGADEILIQHRGREYRLRITQNGKLILNA